MLCIMHSGYLKDLSLKSQLLHWTAVFAEVI